MTTTTRRAPSRKKHSSHIALPLASLTMAIASSIHVPQVAAQDGIRLLEEVVVTARRKEENLQEVPIAVAAMDEDFLRSQNISEVESLGTQVPSMRVSSSGTDTNTPIISIRGQRPFEARIEQDPAAPMYFNDVVMSPSTGTNLALYDLQGVQVLKGPQGTLFGRNSTGGAVLMTPKRPSNEFGGYAEAKLGNYNLRQVEGAVDIPVSETLSMRVSGRRVDRDGYQENIADNALRGQDARGEDSESVRLGLLYEGEKVTNYTVLAHDHNKSGSPVPQIIGLNTFNRASGGTRMEQIAQAAGTSFAAAIQDNVDRDNPWKFKSDVKGTDEVTNTFASNTTEFEISDGLTVKNIAGYRKVNRKAAADADGTALAMSGAITDVQLSDGDSIFDVTLDPKLNETEAEQFSDEIQLLGSSFDDRLDWIVGGYFYKMEGSLEDNLQQILDGRGVNASLSGTYDFGGYDAENRTKGLFGEGTWTFNEAWSLTAGIRKTWDERKITVRKLTGPSNDISEASCQIYAKGVDPETGNALPNDACERTESANFDKVTWRLSLNYTPADGHLVYGSVSTGYKAGGFNSRANSDNNFDPFNEENVITYEIGHKGDWSLSWADVRTNTAIYLQDYDDIQQTVTKPEGFSLRTETINASKAEIKGFEFDVMVLPSENLMLGLSYSYVDAGYKDHEVSITNLLSVADPSLPETITADGSDNDFGFIPKQSLTASVTYTLPVEASLGEMSVMASAYWQGDMNTHPLAGDFAELYQSDDLVGFGGLADLRWSDADVAFAEEISNVKGYAVYNLRYDWRNVMGSQFDFAAWVNNVTDEQYVIGGLNVIDILYAGYTYGAPRTFGASVRYTF